MDQLKENSVADDFDDVDIDAFGLDQFGQARGLNPLWGAAAGSGLGTAVAIGLKRWGSPKLKEHREAIGFLTGAAAGGAMIAMKNTRAAGWTALAAAFLNNGLRALNNYLEDDETKEAKTVKGYMDGVVISPTTAFSGYGGMGLVEVSPTTAFSDAELPQLVGASLQSASDQVQLVGGPALSDLASHYGATHFSR
jgi:hypothetical protein